MKKEIIINSALNEIRAAITEDGRLAEFFIEMPEKQRYIGNIYLGRVNKVVASINAAFIDIGTKQDAFLHFSDIDESLEDSFDDDDDDDKKGSGRAEGEAKLDSKHVLERFNSDVNFKGGKLAVFSTKRSGDVVINLTPGQYVLVQITREAYQHKGVKVSTKIAIPGRYTVLLPFESMVGVSKKISNYKEKKRLRRLAKTALPEGFGCIIRTAAKNKTEEELVSDWEIMLETWQGIQQKVETASGPGLVYQDFNLAASLVRDMFTTEVQKMVVDSKKLYKDIVKYVRRVSPHLESKIMLYNGKTPIFEEFGVERDLNNTVRRKVPMPSGGDVVFEQTEAMYVVDVNSGRSTDKTQEGNSLKTNLEAAKEIAKQLRLRDVGGMIVIDFIDMMKDQNRRRLLYEMKREMSKDRAQTVIYPLSQLGLMQITRQRINQNIQEKITEICPTCNGTGRITSKSVMINDIERWLRNFRKTSKEFRLILYIHPSVVEYLTEGVMSIASKLMLKYFIKLNIRQDNSIKPDTFKVFSVRQQRDITNDY